MLNENVFQLSLPSRSLQIYHWEIFWLYFRKLQGYLNLCGPFCITRGWSFERKRALESLPYTFFCLVFKKDGILSMYFFKKFLRRYPLRCQYSFVITREIITQIFELNISWNLKRFDVFLCKLTGVWTSLNAYEL